ncbi:MAG: GNAT family N-acetyltransferase, partial [Solobacterium sp.]|nr:GNAT family N-acetyltransferase [Solobacterium sp.]
DKKRYVRAIRFNDRLIGFINDVGCANGSIELGIALSSRYHGKGYGTRAFKMAIAELFNMGYKEVIAGCFIENEASRRMMEKCGMVKTDIVEEIEYRGVMYEAIYLKIENAHSVSCK